MTDTMLSPVRIMAALDNARDVLGMELQPGIRARIYAHMTASTFAEREQTWGGIRNLVLEDTDPRANPGGVSLEDALVRHYGAAYATVNPSAFTVLDVLESLAGVRS